MDKTNQKLGPLRIQSEETSNEQTVGDKLKVGTSTKNSGMVTIKTESINDEFKEYAETAMNELLGWYGYSNNNNNNHELNNKRNTSTTNHSKDNNIIHKTDNNKGHETETMERYHKQQQEVRKLGNSSDTESPKSTDLCDWCGKSIDETAALTSNDAIFCSELCFSQSRRANFKRNKTCDWCKHVRHTVSYVDYEDGSTQLQFCSDKCLNQYKMHIFCRETRAHLEMHPHLPTSDSSSGLITPDLWMRNCSSPGSRNHSPVRIAEPQTSPLPLITVAHPSKLMTPSTNANNIETAASTTPSLPRSRKKRLRKRSMLQIHKNHNNHNNDVPQDLRVVQQNPKHFLTSPSTTSSTSHNNGQEGPGSILDMRELSSSQLFVNGGPEFFHPKFAKATETTSTAQGGTGGSNNIPIPVPFPNLNNMPQIMGNLLLPPRIPPNSTNSIQPPLTFPRPPGILPPVTVMVPYPVLIPVPLPIPIPLPVTTFMQAANLKANNCSNHNSNENHVNGHRSETDFEEGVHNLNGHSDEEEIIVDDDNSTTRLNPNNKKPQDEIMDDDDNDDIDSSKEETSVFVSTQLQVRKRKQSERNNGAVATKIKNNKTSNNNNNINNHNNNYKHKKSMSV